MAISKENYVTKGLTGAVGKEFVFKRFNGKTIVCKYPDRSQVKYNKKQTRFQKIFAEASAFASDVMVCSRSSGLGSRETYHYNTTWLSFFHDFWSNLPEY